MKAIKYVLVALMLCASAGANAQVSAPASSVPLIVAPTVMTSEQKAAVKELLEVINFKKMVSQNMSSVVQSVPQMMEQMVAGLDASLNSEQKAEARKLASKASESAMKSILDIYKDPQIIDSMEDIMTRAYGSRFEVDEIKVITAFYTGPVGKKMLATSPQIMQQTMPEIMALITPRMKDVMSKMAKDIAEQAKADAKTSIASMPK